MVFYEKNSNELTVTAKKEELQGKGLSEPTTYVAKAISKDELARHCRRQTTSADEATRKFLENLLLTRKNLYGNNQT